MEHDDHRSTDRPQDVMGAGSSQAIDSRPTAPTAEPVVPVLQCAHFTRHFGDRLAVDDVTFSVQPGETYGLLGPKRGGQDHDDPHDLRVAATRWWHHRHRRDAAERAVD